LRKAALRIICDDGMVASIIRFKELVMTTIAFIGLGSMGGPMAANLVRAATK
jgi:hypothetical protein